MQLATKTATALRKIKSLIQILASRIKVLLTFWYRLCIFKPKTDIIFIVVYNIQFERVEHLSFANVINRLITDIVIMHNRHNVFTIIQLPLAVYGISSSFMNSFLYCELQQRHNLN